MTPPGTGGFSEEVADFLESHREISLFCRDAEGRPIGYPMFVFGHGSDTILFSTYRKSAKVGHIERDPRVALLSVRPDGPRRVRWLEMHGRAEVWAPDAVEVERLFSGRRGDPRVPDTMGDLVRQRTLEGKRVLLRVEVADAPGWRVQEAVR